MVLIEIRGVGGATAGEILGGQVTQTAGDELAGFYRADDPSKATPTEAYEWGRLTSGSRTSALVVDPVPVHADQRRRLDVPANSCGTLLNYSSPGSGADHGPVQ